MSRKVVSNVGASVRARLQHLARQQGDDFQLVLLRYVNERLLYRLTQSAHAQRFVLKGAALFTLWSGHPHRATRDLDLLGFGDCHEAHLRGVFREVLSQEVEDDGVQFDVDSLEVGPIRDDLEYSAVRVLFFAHVTTAKVRVQVDIGFGDAITPPPAMVAFPTLLDQPAPRVRAYPRETVVAEKLEAAVKLGLANSRMKDFYDLAVLPGMFGFEGELLVDAIRATFERRQTPLPNGLPVALTAAFGEAKQTQWRAFVRKSGVANAGNLTETIDAIAGFVERPLTAARAGTAFQSTWAPGGPWT
jgi:predicted nucleotidyltransferase component of viral defense system